LKKNLFKNKKSLRKSLTSLNILLIAGMFLISSGFMYLVSKESIDSTLSQNNIHHAQRIADEIDADKYKNFLANPSKNETYGEFREQLNDYREKIGALYVYTLQTNEQNVAIIVDGMGSNEEAVDIGEPTTATTFEDVAPVLDGDVTSTDIVKDPEYGDYMSAFAPIKDKDGQVVGILGVDMDAEQAGAITNHVLVNSMPLILGIFTLVLVGILTIIYVYLGKRLKPLTELREVAVSISEGKLTHANNLLVGAKNKNQDEIHELFVSMRKMHDSLEEITQSMKNVSLKVDKQSERLSGASAELSQGSLQVSSTMQEMAAGSESQATLSSDFAENMQEFTELILTTKNQGKNVFESTTTVQENASNGTKLMSDSIDKMESIYHVVVESVQKVKTLESQTSEVTSLVTLISQIAEQTNLLALNAAIEAARAGEHGKGFAVVADEVRKLAENVSNSVKSIHDIVDNVNDNSKEMAKTLGQGLIEVEQGREDLKNTGIAFGEISSTITSINDLVASMSGQLDRVVNKQEKMKESIEEIAAISEENAAGIEQVSASSQQMSGGAEEMNNLVEELVNMSTELRMINEKFS
jgi:methyl-accepting chemotaxis protein